MKVTADEKGSPATFKVRSDYLVKAMKCKHATKGEGELWSLICDYVCRD